MESLVLLRKHLAMSGIGLHGSSQQYPFNTRNSSVLIVIGFGVTLYAKQLYQSATFEEHAYVVYQIVTSCFCFTSFLSIINETPKLFKIMDDFDCIVNNSKWN